MTKQEGKKSILDAPTDMEDFLHSQPCLEVAKTLSLVGDKWTVLVIVLLGSRPRRFNELKRAIGGITQRSLTITLRQLEREGLVTRTVYPTIPPRVDYELSELGRSLCEPIKRLSVWVIDNSQAMTAAREDFDERATMQLATYPASHADRA